MKDTEHTFSIYVNRLRSHKRHNNKPLGYPKKFIVVPIISVLRHVYLLADYASDLTPEISCFQFCIWQAILQIAGGPFQLFSHNQLFCQFGDCFIRVSERNYVFRYYTDYFKTALKY